MLDIKEGEKAVRFARNVIEEYVKKNSVPEMGVKDSFQENQGAFVTIHTYPDHALRGCIGIPLPVMPLKEAIKEGATSATRDPRFPPLAESELDSIVVEVTILTKPEIIKVNYPKEYLEKIEIGRDGLIVERGIFKGLLLPQVPIEQGWLCPNLQGCGFAVTHHLGVLWQFQEFATPGYGALALGGDRVDGECLAEDPSACFCLDETCFRQPPKEVVDVGAERAVVIHMEWHGERADASLRQTPSKCERHLHHVHDVLLTAN